MRFLLIPCVFLAVTAVVAKPGPKEAGPQGFQLSEGDLHAAAGRMDESLKDMWHEAYLISAAQMKEAGPKDPVPPEVSDEVFLRRATLDATDVIPTAEEVRAFLADTAPDKRGRLVDRLLLSPRHAEWQFNRYAELLRLRDVVGGVSQAGYIELVRAAARKNMPFDQFIHSLLIASGSVADNPAMGFLLRDQGNLLTTVDQIQWSLLRDDVHCAACHDHPFGDATQVQFYELASCFAATRVVLQKAAQPKGEAIEVWPLHAYRKARAHSFEWDGKLTLQDTGEFGLRLPEVYKYRDRKPDEPLTYASPIPPYPELRNAPEKIVWKDAAHVREEFAHWLVTQDRFAQVAGVRIWQSLFGRVRTAARSMEDGYRSLLPSPAPPAPASSLPTARPMACDVAGRWTNADNGDFYDGPPAADKFRNLLTALIRSVHFDLREFQRVLMHTHAYARVATPDLRMSWPRFGAPLAPFLRRLSPEQIWNSLVMLGGADQGEWRNAGDLPQSLPATHGLRVLGRGARAYCDDSDRAVSYSLTRFMMNSEAVRHASTGPEPSSAQVKPKSQEVCRQQAHAVFLAILGRPPRADKEWDQATEVLAQPEGARHLAWSLLNTSEFLFEQ